MAELTLINRTGNKSGIGRFVTLKGDDGFDYASVDDVVVGVIIESVPNGEPCKIGTNGGYPVHIHRSVGRHGIIRLAVNGDGAPKGAGMPVGDKTEYTRVGTAKSSGTGLKASIVSISSVEPSSSGGLPPGGTTNQVLGKDSGVDYDVSWQTVGGTGTVTSVGAGDGMSFTSITGAGDVDMGTPSSITASSSNATTSTSHSHELDVDGSDFDHGDLQGLEDDDHTQYALRDLAGAEDDIILHTEESGAIDATAGVLYSGVTGHLAAIAISDTTSHTNTVYGAHIVGEDAEVLSQSYDTVTSDGVTMDISHDTGITFTDNNNNREFVIGSLLTYGDRFELITGMADGVGFVAGDSFGGTTHSASMSLSETTTNAAAALGVGEQTTNDYARIQFEAAPAGDFPITVTDEIESIGMAYAADYSANGTSEDRWIPDYAAVKAYADSVGGGDVSWGTPSNNYLVYGDSVSGDVASTSTLNFTTGVLNAPDITVSALSGGGEHLISADASGNINTGNLSGDVTTSGSMSVTAAAALITGKTALTTGLADTDELLVNDDGSLKRMDMSVLKDYLQKEYASYYLSTGGVTAVAATATQLTVNQTSVESDATQFDLTSSIITVEKAGDYEISYQVYFNSGGTSRSEYTVWLEIDEVEVSGSRTGTYQRGYDSGDTASGSLIMDVPAGSEFALWIQRTDGAGSTGYQDDNGTRISFKEM